MTTDDADTPIATPPKSLVLIGLMGAGKSSVGRRLAARLNLPFVDADDEIEAAAGCPIADIFERFGEDAFREGERKVIARLMEGPVKVLATGGGAFMNDETRKLIAERGLSVWLRAELSVLAERVSRRDHRPLLKGRDPDRVLRALAEERHPVYAQADIIVDTGTGPHEDVVEAIVQALHNHQSEESRAS